MSGGLVNRGVPLTRRAGLARGAGPVRRTALQRSGQLRRSTGLAATGRIERRTALTVVRHPVVDDPTRFPGRVIDDAHTRCGGHCERCPQWIGDGRWAPHHRRPKGTGGTSLPDTHTLPNCLAVCVVCHAWIHDNPQESEAAGWLIFHPGVPAVTPVLVRDVDRRQVRVLLTAAGRYGEVPA